MMKTFKYKHIITENYLDIEAAVNEAIKYKLFLLIFGDSGFGKTFTYKDLERKSNNSIHHHQILKSDKPLDLYNNVISTFPNYANYKSSSIKWTIEKASDLYRNKKEQSLLILDEANQFKPGMLGYIREFRDKTEFSSGLIISGPDEFYEDLMEWKDARVKGINEFWTRKDDIIVINECSESDMTNICIANEIRDQKTINILIDESEGNFRGLHKGILKYYRNLGYDIIEEAA